QPEDREPANADARCALDFKLVLISHMPLGAGDSNDPISHSFKDGVGQVQLPTWPWLVIRIKSFIQGVARNWGWRASLSGMKRLDEEVEGPYRPHNSFALKDGRR